jgi:hypothetical protein
VAAVHAAWDRDCAACHVNFQRMSRDNWNPLMPFLGSAATSSASDARCASCHAGPVHHANQLADSTPSCGGCHRDHQGRDFSLVRLPDSDCVRCHDNLKAHQSDPDKLKYENAVTGFAGGHPEFKLLREGPATDPGKLKFNHKLHMTAGQAAVAGQENAWTLGKIKELDPSAHARYRDAPWQKDKADSALVQLDCASCHRLDSGDFDITKRPPGLPQFALQPRAPGAYMQSIVYENQCQACHPLTFDAEVKVKGDDDRARAVAVPHRLEPGAVSRFLWGAYADQYQKNLKKDPELGKGSQAATPGDIRPLPGRLTREEEQARGQIDREVEQAQRFLFKDRVEQAERYLLSGKTSCGECHYYEQGEAGLPRAIVPTAVKDVWFEHARFNHAAHRAVDCRSCHANAYAVGANGEMNSNASTRHTDVLLPGVENCRSCHAPAGRKAGQPVGGVRHDCTECHSYHNGARPLEGLGAAARDPEHRVDIQRLLEGAKD